MRHLWIIEENTLHNLMGEAFKLEHNSQPLFKQNDLTIFKIYIENSLRYRPVSFNDYLNKMNSMKFKS